MNINWKVKSSIFRFIDVLSLHKTLYFLQKHVTKRARINISEISEYWTTHQRHLANLQNPNILEFGAGKSLSLNIYLSQYVKSQTVVDLFPMLDIDLFNDAASQISILQTSTNFPKVYNMFDIEKKYNIHYVAPLDVSKTSFTDNNFDGCISTVTLEHIPKEDIIAIYTELKRIIRPEGIISAIIDYSDHYSHTDKSIGSLNYLQYSSEEFKNFNHRIHYQNRLRHYDYLNIFKDLGYILVKEVALNFAEPPDVISNEFDKSEPSLCATKGIFLLQNSKQYH